jgi:hypothetical protein
MPLQVPQEPIITEKKKNGGTVAHWSGTASGAGVVTPRYGLANTVL